MGGCPEDLDAFRLMALDGRHIHIYIYIYICLFVWAPSRKAVEIPRVSTRFSLSVENEQADAGRDGRTRLARQKSQARTGKGKQIFSPIQLNTSSRIVNHNIRLIHALLKVLTIHT